MGTIQNVIFIATILKLFVSVQTQVTAFSTPTTIMVPSIVVPSETQTFDVENEKEEMVEGESPSKVVIERLVPYPQTGLTDIVVLRNEGGKVANLSGWKLLDDKLEPEMIFGLPGCEDDAIIQAQQSVTLYPLTEDNPCGFPFGISYKDGIMLKDDMGNLVANVSWEISEKGASIHKIDDQYVMLSSSTTVMDILESISQFSKFTMLLKETGLDQLLLAQTNPEYTSPEPPSSPPPDYQIEFPWWFGWAVDTSSIPPPPPPPPPPPSPPQGQIPEMGPYTILAPTNEAIDSLLVMLTGGRVKIPLDLLLKLPELKMILQYHIIYGSYTSEYMFNNTGIQTTLGPEVVVMQEPRWTEGRIALNDACVDKPTTGFPCEQQLEFDKCWEPFMISPLVAGWQGGFCQKTCQRCTCDPALNVCSTIQYPDIIAGNGIIQGISRVLFPPQTFDQIEEGGDSPSQEEEEEEGVLSTNENEIQLPQLPTMPSLNNNRS